MFVLPIQDIDETLVGGISGKYPGYGMETAVFNGRHRILLMKVVATKLSVIFIMNEMGLFRGLYESSD